ncbi:hypothetical protein QOT17_019049 [Balamuthia mandrillaris]
MTKYKIGGGDDGVAVWTQLGGRPANSRVAGWEMKFEVDGSGNVSGGNKNDGADGGAKKTYSGSFANGQLNVTATFTTGQVNTYVGTVSGNKFNGTLTVIKVAPGGGGTVGDTGTISGTVKTE